jgi:eukaryotic-like serine/threonine-protein kinase
MTPAQTLGPYQIVEKLGEGGMGEVYRAHDPRVGRDVAIKIAASSFTERFEREGRAVAALNHVNICQLYDVGAVPSGPGYLVMELVEGPTLAEVIAGKGALPVDEALEIARQIAAALEAAHDKGIIHRDLKPANIKVTPDGVVKVLDFGLAKLSDPGDPGAVAVENSPTMTVGATQAGLILGTAAYMAPEQARGKTVDKRVDIWAFGVIVHEMITGDRLFAGDTVADTLIEVATKEVAWDRVPPKLQPLLRKCLERDPRKRLRDIGDLALLLEAAPATAPASLAPVRTSAFSGRLAFAGWGVAAIATMAAAALAVVHFREQLPAADVVRLRIQPPERAVFDNAILLSPDGRKLAFTTTPIGPGTPQIWVRTLDTLDARPVAPWSGNAVPFWSPDSRFIGYQQEGKLKKVDIAGGPPTTLCDAPAGFAGGAWSAEGVIVFGDRNGPLSRVSAGGGVPAPLTVLDSVLRDISHGLPSFLPDGRHFLYLRRSSDTEKTGIYIGSVDNAPNQQEPKLLVATTYGGVYVPAPASLNLASSVGFLLFLRDSTLLAQPFDTRKLALAGEPVPIAEGLSGTSYGFARFSASAAGALAYRTGGSSTSMLTWYDRQGRLLGTIGERAAYGSLAISPDGHRVAVDRNDTRGGWDLWLIESAAGGRSERFTFDPAADTAPVWSPDGRFIAFASNRSGRFNLLRKPSNLSSNESEVFKSDDSKIPTDWPREDLLIFSALGAKTGSDMWSLSLTGEPKASEFLHTEFGERHGRLSPDGRWLVYAANYSGRYEVYVRPFPASAERGGQFLVSNGFGGFPVWRADGKEILYLDGSTEKVMSVPVTPAAEVTHGAPVPLFGAPSIAPSGLGGYVWDITRDGSRFLFIVAGSESNQEPITLVLN